MTEIRAAVVGSGMMGPGIAVVLAAGGADTCLISRSTLGSQRALSTSHRLLDQLQANDLITAGDAAATRRRIRSTSGLKDGLDSAQLIVESIPEDLPLKQQFFDQMSKLSSSDAILASNTSGLSITAIAERTAHPERVLTAHFWNPPHLMPLVEVVMGKKTSESVALKLVEWLRQCGKTPVLVKKDRPGQLGNRLQHALVREAIYIVQQGIASAEDVDLAVKRGFGLRLPAWGVFDHADAVGLNLVKAIQDYVLPDLSQEQSASPLLNDMIARGQSGHQAGQGFHDWSQHDMGARQSERDLFLIQFLKHLKESGG
ncbi:MAG: 3-hydroxyacyl-CoA dehydrogenase family protein [Acidobacteriota bacterium]